MVIELIINSGENKIEIVRKIVIDKDDNVCFVLFVFVFKVDNFIYKYYNRIWVKKKIVNKICNWRNGWWEKVVK